MGEEKDNRLFLLQQRLSLAFLVFLVTNLILQAVYMVSSYGRASLLDLQLLQTYGIPVFAVLIVLDTLPLFVDRNWARAIQCLDFFLISFYCLYFSPSDFWGWGFGLTALLVLYKYGFFRRQLKFKIFLIVMAFVIVSIAQSFTSEESVYICLLVNILYVSFFLMFSFLLLKDEIQTFAASRRELNQGKLDLAEKREALHLKLHELETIEAGLKMQLKENQAFTKALAVEMQKAGMDGKALDARYRKALVDGIGIKNSIRRIGEEKAAASLGGDSADGLNEKAWQIIINSKEFCLLSQQEKELVFEFFIHNGNATNKEMAVALHASESAIKNRMFSIYKKLETVSTRTALFSFANEVVNRNADMLSSL